MAWKFRTMVVNGDEVLKAYLAANPAARDEWRRDHKLKNDPRVTWIGRILRKTSLDELPQLWNVVRGEMSLVGPRPIVRAEIPKYGEQFDVYIRAVPGITGIWQISGRNDTGYRQRVALDVEYVSTWSVWLDLKILFNTVFVVLGQKGAY
jgi:lipopolysaccharide/colanic/teichoic acid biosynthesis glycosyltransferase